MKIKKATKSEIENLCKKLTLIKDDLEFIRIMNNLSDYYMLGFFEYAFDNILQLDNVLSRVSKTKGLWKTEESIKSQSKIIIDLKESMKDCPDIINALKKMENDNEMERINLSAKRN